MSTEQGESLKYQYGVQLPSPPKIFKRFKPVILLSLFNQELISTIISSTEKTLKLHGSIKNSVTE